MRRRLLVAIAVLALVVVASVAAPHAMLSPGNLLEGHRDLEADCFACHVAFRGPDGRCRSCHALDAIDPPAADRPPFHASLADPKCHACHADHRGRDAARARRAFRHDLLRADVRAVCGGCHDAPADALHERAGPDCGRCHAVRGWSPAAFDHTELFRFDRDHPADCATCHPSTFEAFTCYGCHEHRPAGIEREHRKEGILDVEDCADCHRSGDEDEAKRAWRRRVRDEDDD